MCIPALLGALGGAGAAGAAGAVAGAATAAGAGSTLATFGTLLSAGGSLLQGVMAMQAANENARYMEQQREDEKNLSAIEEERARREFRFSIGQQAAELAGRGVRLDSPMAVFLGETAAREMSFESQSIRSRGAARSTELTHSARMARAQGAQAMFSGFTSAVGSVLTAAPRLWPGMLR